MQLVYAVGAMMTYGNFLQFAIGIPACGADELVTNRFSRDSRHPSM